MSDCSCNTAVQKTDAEKAQEIRMICLQMAMQLGQGVKEAEVLFKYITDGTIPA